MTMTTIFRPAAILALVLALLAGTAWAQHGPRIPPCEGCPVSETERPYPRTGMWFDPERDGSGINLEVQNGVAFGLFFSYTEDGDPVWYEFSGRLRPVEDGGEGYWTLSSDLVRFTGGACIDCPYRAPEIAGSRGRFDLTVIQRNLISYTLDGGETYRMLPLVWGTPMSVEFPEVSDHGQPMFPRDEQVSPWGFESGKVPWMLALRTPDPGTGLYLQSSAVFWVSSGSAANRREFLMNFFQIFAHSPELVIPITMACGSVDEPNVHGDIPPDLRERLGSEPLCILRRQVGTGLFNFYMAPLGNVGDDYFIATAEDGSVIEGHRLLYR